MVKTPVETAIHKKNSFGMSSSLAPHKRQYLEVNHLARLGKVQPQRTRCFCMALGRHRPSPAVVSPLPNRGE